MMQSPLSGYCGNGSRARAGRLWLIVLAVLFAGFLLYGPQSTAAQEAAAQEAPEETAAALSDDELGALVETLEDPAERERFLGDLKSLLAARAVIEGESD